MWNDSVKSSWEVVLRVEICRRRDYPVAILVGVYIPTIVIVSKDVLSHYPLCVLNLLACLNFDVVGDCPLTDRVGHGVTAEDVFHGGRRDRAFGLDPPLLTLISLTLQRETVLDFVHMFCHTR